MHQEVNKNQSEFLTSREHCWEHHLDLLHLCNGEFMLDNREPINHSKLLHYNGYNFKDFVWTFFCVLGLRTARVVARDAHGIYAPWDSAPVSVGGVWVGGWSVVFGGGGSKSPVMGPNRPPVGAELNCQSAWPVTGISSPPPYAPRSMPCVHVPRYFKGGPGMPGMPERRETRAGGRDKQGAATEGSEGEKGPGGTELGPLGASACPIIRWDTVATL
jgi:hypothetical protein